MRTHLIRTRFAPTLLAFGLFTGCVPLSDSDLGSLPETKPPVEAESFGTELLDAEMVETNFGDEMPSAVERSAGGKATELAPRTPESIDFDEPDATTEVRVAVLARKIPVAQEASEKATPTGDRASELALRPEIESAGQPALVSINEAAVDWSEPSEEPIAGGWYVQISAETEAVSASSISERLAQLGFETQLQRAIVEGTRYVRVLVGPYSSKEQAFAARAQVAPHQIGTGKPFVKQVR